MEDASLGILMFGLAAVKIFILLMILGKLASLFGWMKVFKKAGMEPWTAFIPLYASYAQFDLVWEGTPFFIMLASGILGGIIGLSSFILFRIIGMLLGFVSGAIYFLCMDKLAYSFGKSRAFAAGLLLLQPIFIIILALSEDEFIPA